MLVSSSSFSASYFEMRSLTESGETAILARLAGQQALRNELRSLCFCAASTRLQFPEASHSGHIEALTVPF